MSGGGWASARLQALDALVEEALPRDDLSHDMHHVRRVAAWAARLAPELGADPERAAAAGLCHDLDPTPKEGPDRAAGGARAAAAAPTLLRVAGFEDDAVQAICAAITTCSWSAGAPPAGPLGACLQDADRLDAIGALGIARNMACAAVMHRRSGQGALVHPTDPPGGARPLDDRRFAADHYPIKLLRLAAGMHSPTARAEAARRHGRLLAFYDALLDEAAAAQPGAV
jgi:uncharacterized protein